MVARPPPIKLIFKKYPNKRGLKLQNIKKLMFYQIYNFGCGFE